MLCLNLYRALFCAFRYIRYIYNRIILENATVRAAAVSALASFGARVPELTGRVVVLLKRALYDNDDEVRGIATFVALQSLLAGQKRAT
jgi:HEAT repeat protein